MGIAKEFVQFCKKKGITRLHKLSYDAVESFLVEKIIIREVSGNTVETNVCALQKFFHVCGRYDLRDQLSADYSRFKYLAKEGGAIHAFDNPGKLIEKIGKRDELSAVIARLEELSTGVDWQHYCQRRHSPYQGHVKAACRTLGDEYGGAHGLRTNYSQELRKKLEGKGLTDKEIERITTRDLGHERRSMARHYLGV